MKNLCVLSRNGSMTILELREMRSAMGKVRRKIADISIKIGALEAEIVELRLSLLSCENEQKELLKKNEKYILRIAEKKSEVRLMMNTSEENETEEMGYDRSTGHEQ